MSSFSIELVSVVKHPNKIKPGVAITGLIQNLNYQVSILPLQSLYKHGIYFIPNLLFYNRNKSMFRIEKNIAHIHNIKKKKVYFSIFRRMACLKNAH